MNDVAISIVSQYSGQKQCSCWLKEDFERLSYSRWASCEILKLLMDNPLKQPMDVIDGFYLRMTLLSKVASGTKRESVFRCAAETADQILLELV